MGIRIIFGEKLNHIHSLPQKRIFVKKGNMGTWEIKQGIFLPQFYICNSYAK